MTLKKDLLKIRKRHKCEPLKTFSRMSLSQIQPRETNDPSFKIMETLFQNYLAKNYKELLSLQL